jgi:hypothetical protein
MLSPTLNILLNVNESISPSDAKGFTLAMHSIEKQTNDLNDFNPLFKKGKKLFD